MFTTNSLLYITTNSLHTAYFVYKIKLTWMVFTNFLVNSLYMYILNTLTVHTFYITYNVIL